MSDFSSSQGGSGPSYKNAASSSGGQTQGSDGGRPGSIADKASAVARDLKDQASDATKQIKNQASDLMTSAKDLAGDAKDKLSDAIGDQLNQQKAAGADYVGNIANAVRSAANGFESDLPQAAEYIRLAAGQIDGVSSALRKRDFNELIGGVQDFARRQPTAFLGVAVVAGFALVRFLKSTGGGQAPAGQSNFGGSSAGSSPAGSSPAGNASGNYPRPSSPATAAPRVLRCWTRRPGGHPASRRPGLGERNGP